MATNLRIDTLRRQQILAHLNSQGTSNVKEISEALGLDRSTVRTYIKALLAIKAVSHRTKIVGTAATPYYRALIPSLPPAPETPPARITNLGTERPHPLPNHGGQGALRRAFGIQSVMG